MRNVLQQLIQLYPNDNAVVAMDSGNNSSGRLGSLLPAGPNAGLLQLVNSQGVPQEAVSICRIASVRITSASYNNAITYLPVPVLFTPDTFRILFCLLSTYVRARCRCIC